MWHRRPPTLGMVGIDFGHKPTISIVALRKRRSRQIDDDKECPLITLVYPEVSVVCDSISASKSKFGRGYASPFSGDGTNKYTQQTTTGSSCGGGQTWSGLVSQYSVWRRVTNVLTGCGSNSGTITSVIDLGLPFATCVSCSGSMTSGCVCSGDCHSCSSFNFVTQDSTLSNEFTTADLIADTEAGLPGYSDEFDCDGTFLSGQGCTCSAFRDLEANETSYTIRRFKHKFSLAGGVTGLAIYWDEIFTPTSGSPTDTARSGAVATTYEVLEPTANGTTSLGHFNRQYKFTFTDPGFDFDLAWKEHVVPAVGSPFDIDKSEHFTTGNSPVFGPYTPTLGNNVTTITNVVCTPS